MFNNSQKTQLIESLLFLKGKMGFKTKELCSIIKISEFDLEQFVAEINKKYLKMNSPFIIKINGDKIRTSINKETSILISEKLNEPIKIKLTKSLIEVLTIISYYQPITRKQINQIRKSNSDYIIAKLSSLDLIESKETAKTPGNPRLWNTTNNFLEAFDLETISDLPNYELTKKVESDLFQDLSVEKTKDI